MTVEFDLAARVSSAHQSIQNEKRLPRAIR
jgi:hypothetical protein